MVQGMGRRKSLRVSSLVRSRRVLARAQGSHPRSFGRRYLHCEWQLPGKSLTFAILYTSQLVAFCVAFPRGMSASADLETSNPVIFGAVVTLYSFS